MRLVSEIPHPLVDVELNPPRPSLTSFFQDRADTLTDD